MCGYDVGLVNYKNHRNVQMNVVCVYVFWGDSMARRFFTYYKQFVPGHSHTLIVVLNDNNWEASMDLFQDIPCLLIEGDNVGKDIGAFQSIADNVDCDLMVFFGNSAYVTGDGWLKRMVESYRKHGYGLYGSMGSGEDKKCGVSNHIRTTGFWMPVELMRSYPYRIDDTHKMRYGFEHGDFSITNWALKQCAKVLMVTWIGEYEIPKWKTAPNAFRNGNQSAVIVRDRLCDPPFWK